MALTNFALWTTVWSTGLILADYSLQLITRKRLDFFSLKDVKPEKSLIEFIKAHHWGCIGIVFGAIVSEIFSAITVTKQQKKTNTIALQAIKNKGINAKFGDA